MTKIKLSIFRRAFEKDIEVIHALFILFLISIIISFFLYSRDNFEESAILIKKHFTERDSIVKRTIANHKGSLIQITKLQEQYEITEKMKEPYFYMAQKFNSYGFTFTLLFTICSIISAMFAFLVLKKGWDNTENFYLKSSFLIFFFSTSLFGILPRVFNNKDNTKDNLAKYNYYNGLQIDIYNLIQDNKGFIKNKKIDSLDIYISNLNTNIKGNQDLYFDTDLDKVSENIKSP